MATVTPYLRFKELPGGTVYSHSLAGDILTWSIDRQADAPARFGCEIDILSAFAATIITATGGPGLLAAITPLLGEFSLDGGTTVDLRFVLTSAQRSLDPSRPVLTISQGDLWELYGVVGTDRVTYVDASPADVLNGAAGTIPRPTGHIGNTPKWPTVKGLYRTIAGMGAWAGQSLLKLTPVVDPILAGTPLSSDINADTHVNATGAIAKRIAGTFLLTDTAPPGSRGHVVPVTGDAVRSPIGVAQALMVARIGTTNKVTFNGDSTGPWNETTTARFSGTGLNIEPLLAELYLQASFIGGLSNHGISTGGSTSGSSATSITALQVINTGRGLSSTTGGAWDDCLCLVGTTSGLHYYPHTGFLVPMSQPLVVNAIGYNATTQTIYLATPHGVFTGSATPPPYRFNRDGSSLQVPPMAHLGGISAPVDDLWMDGANVLVRCGGTTKQNGVGVDGIYIYPALSGDTSGTGQGYAGWSRVTSSGAPLAAGGTAAHLYYTDRNKPTVVYHLQPGTSAAPVACTGMATGQNVTGMYTGGGFVYVTTDAGVAGLYALAIGASGLVNANADSTIRSNDGAAVTVRRIQPFNAPIDGEQIALLAATDAGLYVSPNATGGKWRAPNATSGLGDFDIAMVVAGTPQTVLGRPITRMYAAAERSLLISHNAGDNWQDLLADKLDMGPFWGALAQQCGGTPWPDNSVAALGNVIMGGESSVGGSVYPSSGTLDPSAGGLDIGGTGTILSIPTSSPLGKKHQLPNGWIWARRLNEQNAFTYRLVNLFSVAPMAGMQWHELPELQANADVGVITASEQVALVVFRWLFAASQPRINIPLASSFTQTTAKLRDLYPTDQATLLYNPVGWENVVALNLKMYVQGHTMSGSGGLVRTSTVLGTTMEKSQLDPNALAAAQADRLSKKNRFGSA